MNGKRGISERVKTIESWVTANKTAVQSLKGVGDFMEDVAKQTDNKQKDLDYTLQTIVAQLEIVRLATLRSQAKLEDRLNVLGHNAGLKTEFKSTGCWHLQESGPRIRDIGFRICGQNSS